MHASNGHVGMFLDKSILRFTSLSPMSPSNDTARLALTQWIRSAAQRNIDALVKVGDYYYHGLGVPDEPSTTRGSPYELLALTLCSYVPLFYYLRRFLVSIFFLASFTPTFHPPTLPWTRLFLPHIQLPFDIM